MSDKTERQLDIENLQKLQEEGKITQRYLELMDFKDLDGLATKLSDWRKSDWVFDKTNLAEYGRDQDLDKLVNDPNDLVRAAVADRGREKDLDKLASDESALVRFTVLLTRFQSPIQTS